MDGGKTSSIRHGRGGEMISVDRALQIIVDSVELLEPVMMPILEARGKVLAEDVISRENIPSFDYAVIPGCAIRACDTEGASPSNPVEVIVDGELTPGQPWPTPLKPKHAIKSVPGRLFLMRLTVFFRKNTLSVFLTADYVSISQLNRAITFA